jgi:DNA invertase Pin-like site-specific DNA recombinase
VLVQLDAGDVLIVTWFDRLARPTRDLLNRLAATTDQESRFFGLATPGLTASRANPESARSAMRAVSSPRRCDTMFSDPEPRCT